jgi:phospholipid transport system substrate-binding protein
MRRPSLVVAALLLAVLAAPARAASPTEELRAYTDHVLKVLEDRALDGQDRREAVRKAALEIFDVGETARRALARHWHGRTPAEREEFVRLFADLLERTYITRIDEYGGERVRYLGESVDGTQATVRARIITRRGTEVPVEARMRQQGARWLMYDVLIENVSLVANYRSQFDRIIRTSSFEELMRRLRSRRDELATPRGTSG